jgi:hypothetical protein
MLTINYMTNALLTSSDSIPESQLLAAETLNAEIDLSTDPLVVQMKNTDRLERIRTSMLARADLIFQTSPVSRVMRRDWNIVSAKLFLNSLSPQIRQRISDDLVELVWQSTDLLDSLQTLRKPDDENLWMRPRKLQLQVIHPLAAQWLRCMRNIDSCYLIMINAEKSGVITRKHRWAMLGPTQMAYMGFKASAMNLPLRAAKELLEEIGL